MANNRLYLVCKRTGEKVYIAKYYPSTGWYVPDPETLAARFDAAFLGDAFGKMTYQHARAEGVKAPGGTYDAGAHSLEYEENSEG